VRDVFANKSFPSMIAAMKQAIAISRNDPKWATVRPPLVELDREQASALASALKMINNG
jgi:4-hydroxy-tetrahydrodipicolinate synthase